jgi:hypothetical protein
MRDLALEVARLSAELKKAQLAASNGAFPPSGEIRPTGLTVTNPSTGDMMATQAKPAQRTEDLPVAIEPPSEEE